MIKYYSGFHTVDKISIKLLKIKEELYKFDCKSLKEGEIIIIFGNISLAANIS